MGSNTRELEKGLNSFFDSMNQVKNPDHEPQAASHAKPAPTGSVPKRRGKGRPAKGEERVVLFDDPRNYTFVASGEQIEKLNVIAHRKDLTVKEFFYLIFKDYLERYEKKNGPITLQESKISNGSIY